MNKKERKKIQELDDVFQKHYRFRHGMVTDFELMTHTTIKQECRCYHFIRPPIYVHLSGCPVGSAKQIAKYDRLPWYKKLLTRNPRELYYEHFRA